MGCACKVGEQLTYIQKKYGSQQPPQSKKTHIAETIKGKFKNIGYYMLVIPLIPLMFVYILISRAKGEKSINIEKTFNLKKDV